MAPRKTEYKKIVVNTSDTSAPCAPLVPVEKMQSGATSGSSGDLRDLFRSGDRAILITDLVGKGSELDGLDFTI